MGCVPTRNSPGSSSSSSPRPLPAFLESAGKGWRPEDRGHVWGTVLARPPVTHTGAFDLIKEM